jgi:peptide/nickel transport system permease protein
VVIAIVIAVGTPLGIIAGYFGGVVDEIIMRVSDLVLAFPSLLLAVAIVAALGPSQMNAMIALSVPWWPWYTRITRSLAISLKERQFVEAAKAAGVSSARIMAAHILPNCVTPVIVQATLDMGYIILSLAGLGFLGLGSQPPTPDWGVMISEGRTFILSQWWISTFPGLAILVSVLGFNLAGDGIAEVMNPKRRR